MLRASATVIIEREQAPGPTGRQAHRALNLPPEPRTSMRDQWVRFYPMMRDSARALSPSWSAALRAALVRRTGLCGGIGFSCGMARSISIEMIHDISSNGRAILRSDLNSPTAGLECKIKGLNGTARSVLEDGLPGPDHVDLPLQTRMIRTPRTGSAHHRGVVLWTGAAVRRRDPWSEKAYDEVLSRDPTHVDLTRLNGGVPYVKAEEAFHGSPQPSVGPWSKAMLRPWSSAWSLCDGRHDPGHHVESCQWRKRVRLPARRGTRLHDLQCDRCGDGTSGAVINTFGFQPPSRWE